MAFFCHQIVEKALKAAVAKATEETPPKIHDLIKLAVKGDCYNDLSEERLIFLEELDPFNTEARYPEYKARIDETLTEAKCARILQETEEFLCWIKTRLER